MAAYSGVRDAAFRITGYALGAASYLGKIRFSGEKIVNREVLQTDAVNTPELRPVDSIDARNTIEMLGWDTQLPETTSATTATLTFSEAGGDTGATVAYGPLLPSGYRFGIQRRNGGNPMAQDLELQGSTFTTETFTM